MDIINGCFEAFASIFILGHCLVLYRDKLVRGVSTLSTAFFFAWGLWNIIYYPHLGQVFSFYAGLCVVAANCLWLGMQFYYKQKEVRFG